MSFENMRAVRAANAAHGHFFFSRDTMSYFGSRVETGLLSTPTGQYFVTSEDNFDRTTRQYSLRQVHPSGDITTIEGGYGLETRSHAIDSIPR